MASICSREPSGDTREHSRAYTPDGLARCSCHPATQPWNFWCSCGHVSIGWVLRGRAADVHSVDVVVVVEIQNQNYHADRGLWADISLLDNAGSCAYCGEMVQAQLPEPSRELLGSIEPVCLGGNSMQWER